MVALLLAAIIAAFLPLLAMSGPPGPGKPKADQSKWPSDPFRPINSVDPIGEIDRKHAFGKLLKLKPEIRKHLPTRDVTLWPWDERYLPRDCAYFARKAGAPLPDMFVLNVTYPDCPDPWALCFHRDLKDSMEVDGLLIAFGQLPIHMRSWVKHLIAFPKKYRFEHKEKKKNRKVMATQQQGNVVLYGPSTEWLDVLLHQTAHSMDLNGAFGGVLSSSKTWTHAVTADARVPSKRAAKNMVEDFAESTIVALYFRAIRAMDILGPPSDVPHSENSDHWSKKPGRHPKLRKKIRKAWLNLRFTQFVMRAGTKFEGKDADKDIFDTQGTCTQRVVGSSLVRKEISVVDDTEAPNMPSLDFVLSPGIKAVNLSNAGIDIQYECRYYE